MKLGGINPPSEGFQLRLNTIGLNEISLAVQFFGMSVWRRVVWHFLSKVNIEILCVLC